MYVVTERVGIFLSASNCFVKTSCGETDINYLVEKWNSFLVDFFSPPRAVLATRRTWHFWFSLRDFPILAHLYDVHQEWMVFFFLVPENKEESSCQLLLRPDLSSLHSFLALLGNEANSLPLLECLEALDLDGSEVDKQISATVGGGDEAVALLVVEPLDGSGLSVTLLVSHFCFYR